VPRSSFVAFGATFPKGEGFWSGGDHQIFEAVGARTARPAAQDRNLENLSRGKGCRYPHPSRLRRATFPPGKVFSWYVFASGFLILRPGAATLISHLR
jgi:hypothetical protein